MKTIRLPSIDIMIRKIPILAVGDDIFMVFHLLFEPMRLNAGHIYYLIWVGNPLAGFYIGGVYIKGQLN
jgi:hypothetical protein